jgi:hypothetical protein
MPSIFEDTNPKSLTELLTEIQQCAAALPDFQRDFVWEPSATQELIVSIANNYPAGSLLRIRNTHNLFACREFQGAPPLHTQTTPTFLVLDGQQRLTSLYQAFYGKGEHRYYVKLRDLMDGGDFEECIFYLRLNRAQVKEYNKPEVQARELIMPLNILREGTGAYYKWVFDIANLLPEPERLAQQAALMRLADSWLKAIGDYTFPVVTLSDATSADAVCTIFETLNRTGVKLTVFELLTARFWPKGVNLRALWEESRQAHPILEAFEVDPYYVLQAVALVSSKGAPSCKRKDVLELSIDAVTEWWERAASGLARGLAILQHECGVLLPKWVPYYTMLIPLAAIIAKRGERYGPQAAADKEMLKRWYWCAVFGQAYETGPNARSAKDMAEVVRWLEGSEMPDTISAFKFDPDSLRDATPNQRSVYRGVIGLILSQGPHDLHTSDAITTALVEKEAIDDHHIFPAAYLAERHMPERLRNCVLNRTLIGKTTNQRISDRAPTVYLRDIQGTFERNDLNPDLLAGLLSKHLIPAEPDSPLWNDDFMGFLAERQQLIWSRIQQVTGAKVATHLVESEEDVA